MIINPITRTFAYFDHIFHVKNSLGAAPIEIKQYIILALNVHFNKTKLNFFPLIPQFEYRHSLFYDIVNTRVHIFNVNTYLDRIREIAMYILYLEAFKIS